MITSLKISIDKYYKGIHLRVFAYFLIAMGVSAAIAWGLDKLNGPAWTDQVMRLYSDFSSKASIESALIGSSEGASNFLGAYLVAQFVCSLFLPIVTTRFVLEMIRTSDFTNPKSALLQPQSLPIALITTCVFLGLTYFYRGFDGTTNLSRIIFNSPFLLVWLPACYAGLSISIIHSVAVYLTRVAHKNQTNDNKTE
jgi:hypothetical protein